MFALLIIVHALILANHSVATLLASILICLCATTRKGSSTIENSITTSLTLPYVTASATARNVSIYKNSTATRLAPVLVTLRATTRNVKAAYKNSIATRCSPIVVGFSSTNSC